MKMIIEGWNRMRKMRLVGMNMTIMLCFLICQW